jgi:hypothetical protein
MPKKQSKAPATKPAKETAEPMKLFTKPNEDCANLQADGKCGNIDSVHRYSPCRGEGCPQTIPFDTGDEPKHRRPRAVEPEVMPAGTTAVSILRRAENANSLERIEESIQRDIVLSGRLDKAGAMVGVKIGLALQAGKALLRHGEYEPWVAARFGEQFGTRKAQYFSKLAVVFLRTERSAVLQLPPPEETGKWLAIADEVHPLTQAVAEFVGDKTIAELLDEHGVRPVRAKKGGWRPAQWLVSQYQDLHAELRNLDFEVWTPAQKEAFKLWQENQTAEDDAAPRRMAAEATWETLRATLADHGIGRKTWKLLTTDALASLHDVLSGVARDIGKALKHPETLEA